MAQHATLNGVMAATCACPLPPIPPPLPPPAPPPPPRPGAHDDMEQSMSRQTAAGTACGMAYYGLRAEVTDMRQPTEQF